MNLIIISKVFDGMDIGARFSFVKKLMGYGLSIDVLAYTPDEFERIKRKSVILNDMLSYAVKIS